MTDSKGKTTLEAFSQADLFNRWLFEQVYSSTRGNVLEIGSGIGNLSKLFLEKNTPITLSDIDPVYCLILRSRFNSFQNCKAVINLDLADPDFDQKFKHLVGVFDSIIASNVIEHIKDDEIAFKNARKLLKPGGRLIILVPAFMSLYNKLDTELQHYRRYSAKELKLKLNRNGFDIIKLNYFNMPAIFGWVLVGGLLKFNKIPKVTIQIYDYLVPVLKIIDLFFKKYVGISLVVTGEVKMDTDPDS